MTKLELLSLLRELCYMSYVPCVESNTNITFMFHSSSICCKQALVLFLYSKNIFTIFAFCLLIHVVIVLFYGQYICLYCVCISACLTTSRLFPACYVQFNWTLLFYQTPFQTISLFSSDNVASVQILLRP